MKRRCVYPDCDWAWAVYNEPEDVTASFYRKALATHLRLQHCDNTFNYIERDDVCVLLVRNEHVPRFVAMCDLYALEAGLLGDVGEERGTRAWRDAARRWLIEKELTS